jgi:hypothetical protein
VACQRNQSPKRVKDQPQGDTETERQENPLGGERESGHPIAEGGLSQPRVRVEGEISQLMKERSVQRLDGGLQALDREDQSLDSGTLGVEGGITARQVILNELHEIAVKILISDLLPGSEIELRLIESTTEALDVLGNKARHETAGNDGGEQQQSVDQAAYEEHGMEASVTALDITPACGARAHLAHNFCKRGAEAACRRRSHVFKFTSSGPGFAGNFSALIGRGLKSERGTGSVC